MGNEIEALSRSDSGLMDEDELLTKLPVARTTLYYWRTRQRMPFIRVRGSRKVIYHWQSVANWLLAQQKGGLQ